MTSLMTSGKASDITIHVGHLSFPAHRTILRARSPYFKGMFSSSMLEADSEDIKEVATEPETFEVIFKFIYTDTVDDAAMKAMGEDLLKVCQPKGRK